MVDRLVVGNIYVNRNMIGAVVGVQPFGGEGISGTGPKAGAPTSIASPPDGAGADRYRVGLHVNERAGRGPRP